MKKVIAIILEIIPVISAVLSYTLVAFGPDSGLVRTVIAVTFLLAFLGFIFFFVGRWLAKDDKTVRILGIFDWLATVFIIGFYLFAFLSIAL